MMLDIIGNALDGVSEYTEVRAHQNTNASVVITAGNLTTNAGSVSSGVSARVWKNGFCGLASAGALSADAVGTVLRDALSNARFLDAKLSKPAAALAETPAFTYRSPRDFVPGDQKRMLEYARRLDDYIKTKYTDLSARSVILVTDAMEKLLKTSTGTVSHMINPRACLYVDMSAECADGGNVELFEVMDCGCGYFDDYFTDPEQFAGKLDSLHEQLMQKRDGVFSEAGVCDCIIDPSIAGMIAHEAVGHTVEADLVLGGSVAGPNLGKQVASPLVSIVDFAHTAFGKPAPLPVFVDDEGVECRDTVLIENGVLKGFMNNRESAAHFGMEPTGHARAHGFADEPLIRMRNTAILPGKDKLADMIASIDNGYYLTRTMNGQADTTGEFMFGITMGYEIKNGKLGRALRDTTISGVAFDMLKTVDMLSDEVSWSSSGYCGKKQPMAVSDGGPAVKCRVNIGGR